MHSSHSEIEVTFAIHSDEPLRVVAQLAELTRIGDRLLHPRQDLLLHDRYFDGANAELRARGYGLRLRHVEGRWLLGLKGRTVRRGLVVERQEIEGAATDSALRTSVAAVLGSLWPAALGTTAAAATRALAANPVDALTSAGFVLIQDRRTLRRQRDVICGERGGTALLAIDTVTYVISGTPMRHHEVELEAGVGMDGATLEHLADDVCASFGAVLQPWPPSKLSTGVALEALAERVGTASLVSGRGDLTRRAYALLLEHLRLHHGPIQ